MPLVPLVTPHPTRSRECEQAKKLRPPHRHHEAHGRAGQGEGGQGLAEKTVSRVSVSPNAYGSNVQVLPPGSVTSTSTESYIFSSVMSLKSELPGTYLIQV
jgi:hypothetical protein